MKEIEEVKVTNTEENTENEVTKVTTKDKLRNVWDKAKKPLMVAALLGVGAIGGYKVGHKSDKCESDDLEIIDLNSEE